MYVNYSATIGVFVYFVKLYFYLSSPFKENLEIVKLLLGDIKNSTILKLDATNFFRNVQDLSETLDELVPVASGEGSAPNTRDVNSKPRKRLWKTNV